MRKFLPVSIFVLFFSANAQTVYDRSEATMTENGIQKLYPWVGGLNNPQFSNADLNNDNISDLVVFDRVGNKFLTFLNGGTPNTIDYTYAPEYEVNFPAGAKFWSLLLDYDCDGIEDLFSSKPGWIKRFHGYYNPDNELSFSFVDTLLFEGFNGFWTNVYVAAPDVPAILDVNNDGDIDVITFNILGGKIEYFENQSQEYTGTCSGFFRFHLESECWGRALEPGYIPWPDSANHFILNYQWCPDPFPLLPEQAHSGSTLLGFDEDGDGDKELLIGDISFRNLVRLHNDGNEDTALCLSQDTLFPSYEHSTWLPIFPASFYVDVNNDNLKDIIAAPNAPLTSENYDCVWYYKNVGTSNNVVLDFQTDTFLTEDMLDLGEGAYPVFFDYNADGKMDLIVSNHGYFLDSAVYPAGLALLKNTGTAFDPDFELVTRDYANIISFGFVRPHPAFGDIDGDSDEDMIIGESTGALHYFRNTAGPGNTASFILETANYQSIDVGQHSSPQLVDVDRDGLLDLVIGELNGNLNYYLNTGSVNVPVFTLQSATWGGVSVNQQGFTTGQSVPFLAELDTSGDYSLLVGSEQGLIFHYNNIEGNLSGSFNLVTNNYENIRQGAMTSVHGADINNDGQTDLAIGNYRGGLVLFEHNSNIAPVSINMIDDTTICAGDTVQLFAIPSGGTGTYWIEWTQNSDLTCNNCQSPFAIPEATATYYVMITDSNSIVFDSVTVTVIFPSAVASNDVTICSGGSAAISASGGIFYQWTPVTGLSNPFSANTNASPTATTQYTVEVTDLLGCAAYDSVLVTVSTQLFPDAGSNVSLCEGQFTLLTASGGIIFSWLPTSGLSNPNISNPIATPTVTTTYTVSVSDGVCFGTDAVTITVNPHPEIILAPSYNLCSGDSVQLNALGVNFYGWLPGATLSCTNCSDPLAFPATTTTYTLIGNIASCYDTATSIVFVIPEVQAYFSFTVNGLMIDFFNLSSGATDFMWNFGDGANSSLHSPSHTYNSTGIYTISLFAHNSCFDDVYFITVDLTNNSIVHIDAEAGFEIYPVPNHGEFSVQVDLVDGKEMHLEIINLVGQNVFSESSNIFPSIHDYTFKTNLSIPGIYFVKLSMNGKSMISKMIIE